MTVNYNIMSSQKRKSGLTKANLLKHNKIINDVAGLDHGAIFQQIITMQLEPLKSFEIPSLSTLLDRFQKEVKSPIDIQTSIFHSKSLQRCLQHNNATTLYCVSDKKPLCVTCMYQNSHHKKHKVVPLNRAYKDLEDENNKNLMAIEHSIGIMDRLIAQSHINLTRTQKEFPDILNSLGNFYKGLQELLIQKMNDQMRHIQLVCQKMRYEYASFSQELSDMKIFVVEQVREVKKRQGEEFVLFNRNITHNLTKMEHILNENLCKYHENTYEDQLKKFREIQEKIGQKLVLTSPYKQRVKRQQKKGFSYMNQTSKRIIKNMTVQNQPVEIFNVAKDLAAKKERSLSAKEEQALKRNIDALNKDRKRRSLSPKPFKPAPAVSAHKSPVLAKKTIRA